MATNGEALGITVKFDGETKISGDNGDVETRGGAHVRRVQVDHRLDAPDFFSIDLSMVRDGKFSVLDSIKPGTPIEITLGYETEACIFKGEVSYLEPTFEPGGQDVMRISGYDKAHRLTRGSNSRMWGEGVEATEDIGSIVQDVIGQSKARKGSTADGLSVDTDSPSTKLEYLPQVEVNDYQFIRSLGYGTAMAVDSKSPESPAQIAFKKLSVTGEPKVVICRDRPEPVDARVSLYASFCMSTVRQVGKVEVRGWDPKDKAPILGVAEDVSEAFSGKTGPKTAGAAHYGSESSGRVVSVIDHPVASVEEAEQLAAAIFDQLAMEFTTAEVSIRGVPELTAGDIVELKGFGTRYSGKYMIESVAHMFSSGGHDPYLCQLKLVRNAAPEP